MKRLSALLICSALLLTGCAEDVNNESSLPETEEVAQTTSATTTTSAATTAKTTAPPVIVDDIPEEGENKLPEGYDYIVPTVGDLEAKIVIDESTEVDLLALVEEVGYELPGVDLESDQSYLSLVEYFETHRTEEELEEIRRKNYFDYVGYAPYYVGSDQTDWVVVIDYNTGGQLSPYSRIVHVKNGKIVYTSEVMEMLCEWRYSDGQLFNPADDKGLCVYDIASRKVRYIETADDGTELNVSWYGIYLTDDRYVIFEDSDSTYRSMYLYDRTDGSVTLMKDFYLDHYMHIYQRHGDKLYCYETDYEKYIAYDLETHEITTLDTGDLSAIQSFESGDYIVTSADKSTTYGISSGAVVTRKSDGKVKAFDLRGISGFIGVSDFYADGNWLYFITLESVFALNFNTARIVKVVGAENISRRYRSDGNGNFTNWVIEWSEDGEKRIASRISAGRLTTPQIILRDYDGSAIVPDSTVTVGSGAHNNATDNIFDPTVYSVLSSVVCNGRVWLTDPSDDTVKLYHTGDTVGGLTVKECRTVIDVMDSQSYFNGGYVTFDGSIEITGEAYLDTWGEFLSEKGDIFIELDDDCLFPTIDYSDYRANRRIHITEGITYPEEMTSLLPQDGSKVRVKAVVSGISAEYLHNSRRSGGVGTWAKLVSLELLPEDEPIISQK